MAIQFISLVFLCANFSVAASAGAQGFDTRGAFLAGGVNGSFEDFDTGALDFDDAVGFGVRGGYRFEDWIAAEFQYEWSGTFDGNFLSSEIDLYYIGANARIYPVGVWIQPYALIGVGLLYGRLDTAIGDADETAAAFRLGAGTEIPVFDRLRLTLEASYVIPTGDLEDFDYASVGAGIIWYFGGD